MALAYEGNTDLAFETTVLGDCATKYSGIATDLRTLSADLDKCLQDLTDEKTGWSTPAGTAFHKMTQINWEENIEKYADLLDTLCEILQEAVKDYDNLTTNHIEKTKLPE